MIRRVRTPLLVVAPVALVVVLLIVLLSGLSQRSLPGCANPSDSALNQYCDPVPASTGAYAPQVGEAALATVLPRRVIDRIVASRSRYRDDRLALLRLPAPATRTPIKASAPTRTASVGSLSAPMIAVLAALSLVLVVAAAGRGWRARRMR